MAPGFHLTSAVERLIVRKRQQSGCEPRGRDPGLDPRDPAGRLGEADELAALVVFLMSGAAGYVTGQCVVSDGGWVRGTF